MGGHEVVRGGCSLRRLQKVPRWLKDWMSRIRVRVLDVLSTHPCREKGLSLKHMDSTKFRSRIAALRFDFHAGMV